MLSEMFTQIYSYLHGLGPYGFLLYFLLYMLATVFFIPNPLTFALAGALYGVGAGFVIASAVSLCSAGLFFLLGRYFSKGWLLKKIDRYQKIRMLDEAATDKGWRMVFLLRLTSLMPFSVMNYILGLSKIPFWHYILASWLGMIPCIFLYVYLGAAGVQFFIQGGTREKNPFEWLLIGVSFIVTFVIGIYATREVYKVLTEEERKR